MADTTGILMGYGEIAEYLGLQRSTLHRYRIGRGFPEPDDVTVKDRPRWHKATIDRWIAARPGRGKHKPMSRA